ncbi:MAG: hypothetical protein LBG50_04130 [Clostridiales Family XIII bacterium]|jgi:hypothetical protein|nr:hypothetical protein [Clostridiales Family XIII bacterium]
MDIMAVTIAALLLTDHHRLFILGGIAAFVLVRIVCNMWRHSGKDKTKKPEGGTMGKHGSAAELPHGSAGKEPPVCEVKVYGRE